MSQTISKLLGNRWAFLTVSILIVGCCVLSVGGGGVVLWGGSLVYEFSGVVSCDEFTYDFLKADLPPGARVLKEQCAESFNPGYEVIFVMPAGELPVFEQQEYVSKIEAWQPDPSNSWYDETVWLRVEEDLRKEGASLESALYGWYGDGIVAMHIVVDNSDTQQYYVHYSASYVD